MVLTIGWLTAVRSSDKGNYKTTHKNLHITFITETQIANKQDKQKQIKHTIITIRPLIVFTNIEY